MHSIPSRFRRLDEILYDLPVEDPMLLSELDGYLTAIAVCPAPGLPAAWLPPIWGGAYGEEAPFEDPLDVRQFADMVVARHSEILRELGRGKPQPIFDVDERNGELLWEEWISGFALALDAHPDSWAGLGADPTLSDLRTLVAIADDTTELTSVEVNAICDDAREMILRSVLKLFVARAPGVGAMPEVRPAKQGRNEPCRCGSGAKHKRCCGAG